MKFLLDRMLLREFLPVFISAFLFSVLLFHLVDLFEDVVNYIERDIPLAVILRQQLLYLPQSVVWAFPLSLLFSVSFAMGSLYSNNELISVLGAGRRLGRFLLPLLLLALVTGPALFWFEDSVLIETRRTRQEEQRELLGGRAVGNTNTTVASDGGRLVFFTEYYSRDSDTMDRVTVIERNGRGQLERRVTARRGVWNGSSWDLEEALVFEWTDSSEVESNSVARYENEEYDVSPEVFRRGSQNVEDMGRAQAREFIQRRIEAGLPYRQARTDYLSRYAFALTPIIVTLIAGAVGSRLKRSILLLSILIAMSIAVSFYGAQFVAGMLARFGYVSPEFGAFSPVVLFFLISLLLLSRART